ncbi:MAG: HTTM domain-containing protein, partial [Daejeonella sp.]|nr:HTTM domain-containing protein [Daejeonella sp.]
FLPLRYLLYPGELFWTEEGYRFSWRVMLMEKAGYAQFTVKDSRGKFVVVNNNDFLTVLQEKMMSTQPDMILQYAHILRDHYKKLGFRSPQVYIDSYVALNGRRGRAMISSETDLAQQEESLYPKAWILPLNDEIKGF